MLTVVCPFQKVRHQVWEAFYARLAFTMATFTVLVPWPGFLLNASGFVSLSMAQLRVYKTDRGT
jgi:hypothetical protein